MAMMDSTGWNPHDQQALHAGGDDDFQFLDMGNMGNLGDGLQFDFQDFQNAGAAATLLSQASGGRGEQLDTPMGGTSDASAGAASRNTGAGPGQMGTATSHSTVVQPQMIPAPLQNPTDAIATIDAQIQYLQQQKLQQQQQQIQEQNYYANTGGQVPPTPQSLDMQPNGHPFFSPNHVPQQQPGVYDNRFQRLKEHQDMAFTPLVSPAVTPLDPNFPVDAAYTVPGAYFSPLTSPALHAQNDIIPGYEQRQSSASTNSPGTTEIEPVAAPSAGVADLSKKARKNNATKANRKAAVGKSPITKAQRRKTGPTHPRVSQVLSGMAETNEAADEQRLAQLPMPATDLVDENGSVSPEDLSEMPPPPIPQPRSAGRSPFIHPQNPNQPVGFAPASQGKPSPATPATLMKLPVSSAPSSTPSNPAEPASSEPIETFELPESAAFPKPKLSPLDTRSPLVALPLDHPGSAATARALSAFQALPSPVFAKPRVSASASQSPLLLAGSGSTLTSGSNAKKTPQLAARGGGGGGKKPSSTRSSASSVHVSPALRPRISPNIKPLLPGQPGISAEDTASRLLTHKSNYQNILEGNNVPGVSYPSELSTNLTSKRTSHKIAEQGRRNRINSALQEIATLLPKSVTGREDGLGKGGSDGEGGCGSGSGSGGGGGEEKKGKQGGSGGGGGGGSGGGGPNSKASTVEMAIEYIKQLQQELTAARKRADEAEKRLEMQESGLS